MPDHPRAHPPTTAPDPAGPRTPAVQLVDLDPPVLERLVRAATTDADADEVTPRLSGGDGWDGQRVAWLRAFHTDRRGGWTGPTAEATWAVVVRGEVCGGVRLKRVGPDGLAEAGIWLTRSVRGRGVGTAAVDLLLARAVDLGCTAVRADTSAGNAGALRLLGGAGFALAPGAAGRVQAIRALGSAPPPSPA